MLHELPKSSIKEALQHEQPSLQWEKVNGADTPTAVFNLKKYGLDFSSIKFSLADSQFAKLDATPLSNTWPKQFEDGRDGKWFDGSKFLKFYESHPTVYKGMPAAKQGGVPYVGFLFCGTLDNHNETPAVARILTLDEISPEKIYGHGLAVDPELRRLGFASKFVEYSLLLLNHFKIAERLEWNTNALDSQVSGGWSPTPLWDRFGVKYGKMANYGTNSPSVGDGIFYYANIEASAKVISQKPQWSSWISQLQE
jgi:hypothetical protein